MAALVQSFFSAWITTNTNPAEIPINEVGAGDVTGIPGENPDDLSGSDNEYELGPGTVTHLEDGESVTFGNPNIPTTGFESFVKTLCRLVGAALELPYDVLIITRREEWMAVETILGNGCIMKHITDREDVAFEEIEARYYSGADNPAQYTPATPWTTSNSGWRKDVRAMAKRLSSRGLPATDLLMPSFRPCSRAAFSSREATRRKAGRWRQWPRRLRR